MTTQEYDFQTRFIAEPNGEMKPVSMETWYWEALDWIRTTFGQETETGLIAFAFRIVPDEPFNDVLKAVIWLEFHRYNKDIKTTVTIPLTAALGFFGFDHTPSQKELEDKYLWLLEKIHPDFEAYLQEAYGVLKAYTLSQSQPD